MDLAGEELRNAVHCIGKITGNLTNAIIIGRIDVEDVLDVLF